MPGEAAADNGPGPTFVLRPNETFNAPDGSFLIRQYYPVKEDSGWQLWVKPRGRPAYILPEADPNDSSYEYAAEWHHSPDGRWLIREQTTGSGTGILLSYRCDGNGEVKPGEPFDGRAYEFYARYSGLTRDQCVIDHLRTHFVRWINSHRMVLNLSGQSTMSAPMWVTDDWLMGYDLDRQSFFLTEEMIDKNEHRLYPVTHPVEVPIQKLR
jgi:hypothetical protein